MTPTNVVPPEEIARRLGGISVSQLIAILKDRGYEYTQLMAGSKPWGRGRQVWGMTEEQIETMVAGQAKHHPRPKDVVSANRPAGFRPGHDGKSRIRYPK